MRSASALLLVAILTGCSGSSALTAAALTGTTWAEVCPGSDPVRSFVRLNDDGTFSWSYDAPDAVSYAENNTWSVDGATLTISWNNGFATTAYALDRLADGRLPGVSSKECGDTASLEQL